MSRNKDYLVIPASAGVTVAKGEPRMLTARMIDGGVALYASVAENEDLADGHWSLYIPNEVAEQLAEILWAAAVRTGRRP